MGAGSWIIVVVLISLLAMAAVAAFVGWTSAKDTDVPASGYVAMAIGVIFSLAVGVGLMALVFYSDRKGYDEPPMLIPPADTIEVSGVSDGPVKPQQTQELS
ncbi:hypothetical protein [Tardiphaga robiniae]|uniref:Uncharacterized protein n=1 Tax=Tardiphaga robiniae TaxID=943830 RepID=A0A7G6TYY5_9BRAD|nr:hypothetical protein [Tardiphaga robiniae]QND71967.1 hypothetical protein HB776_12555 [Tardiphaga robiniae]